MDGWMDCGRSHRWTPLRSSAPHRGTEGHPRHHRQFERVHFSQSKHRPTGDIATTAEFTSLHKEEDIAFMSGKCSASEIVRKMHGMGDRAKKRSMHTNEVVDGRGSPLPSFVRPPAITFQSRLPKRETESRFNLLNWSPSIPKTE